MVLLDWQELVRLDGGTGGQVSPPPPQSTVPQLQAMLLSLEHHPQASPEQVFPQLPLSEQVPQLAGGVGVGGIHWQLLLEQTPSVQPEQLTVGVQEPALHHPVCLVSV
ncbi:hypothetical protein A2989_04135 [Candidatus Amesbacteria bacterium RIFCSPLOWO2_01_FULL_48_25]|uniref:Uncharacterized protein n=1 Tax=Candidatus Amesbacteria bacterium RIFCSPLOWO2_01_FULL_48_25 TaxID=1797259 RepID=A0A1F4ZBY1_9BACT|nr:MAG: hypothetical protein A2989_04135 [Candidatus Amesbacteria bacterium RIFCSPLOWO2_01_FULL_48_25]